MVDEAPAATEPLPGRPWRRRPAARLEGQLTEPDGAQRGEVGRLEDHGVAGRERRREAPAGDRHREVPRHDHTDDAEWLMEGDIQPAGDRDLLAEVPLDRARVVGQDVADVARLPAGVPDRVPDRGDLDRREVLQVALDRIGDRRSSLARSAGLPRAIRDKPRRRARSPRPRRRRRPARSWSPPPRWPVDHIVGRWTRRPLGSAALRRADRRSRAMSMRAANRRRSAGFSSGATARRA